MLQEENIIISNYSNRLAKNNVEVTLANELARIKTGYVKTEIEHCRNLLSAGLIGEYKQAKAQLPGVTYSGKFSGAHKSENLIAYSQLMIIDFDGLNIDEVEIKKKLLFDDKHVLAAWLSPSNRGIKVLLKTDSTIETHKIYFAEICNYLANNYDVAADKSGSDTCRICFTSYDPNLLAKKDCMPFSVDLTKLNHVATVSVSKKSVVCINDKALDKITFFATEGRNLKRDREMIDKIIKYLRNRSLSITNNYNDWYRTGLAIANSFTYDIGKKYYLYLCELDGVAHDEYKSINLLDYCYRNRKINAITFSTIVYLAEQKGFINRFKLNRNETD